MPKAASPEPTEDLLPRVRDDLVRHDAIRPGQAVVVAVSGGADSMTLLDLLTRLSEEGWRLALHVAHLDHGLRGAEAEADARFVEAFARELRLPFHTARVDANRLAGEEGRSIEEAARQARMAFLESVLARTDAHRIALGHTRSDQAETVLMRLFRGAGPGGLAGIRPVRDGVWVRPLLRVSRSQVESYARWRELPFRHDRTNTDPVYLRNRIRHRLLPLLERDYARGLEQTLSRTAELLVDEDAALEKIADRYLQKALIYRGKRKIVLDGSELFRYHIAIRRRLFRKTLQWLQTGGDTLAFDSVQRLCETLQHCRTSVQITPGVRASRCGAGVILSRVTPSFSLAVSLPGRTAIPQLDITVVTRLRVAHEVRAQLHTLGPFRACFDRRALAGDLCLRNRCDGDRMRPFGMSGSRKVGDLLIDEKVPRALRDAIPVLTCGDEILWLAGVRRSAAARVGPTSGDVVEMAIEGNGCRLSRIRS